MAFALTRSDVLKLDRILTDLLERSEASGCLVLSLIHI